MFFIVGVDDKTEKKERGRFHCPICGSEQNYTRRVVQRAFTFFFIPVFNLGKKGEFIECDRCKSRLNPGALKP
ncbi:MAG: zinc-ribbon domain-containing protein [Candidatus Hydrogenedentes bacterium]|nr:zinc-ribbon domain-containing protein [Candidatus Hydrogenedentota bacterium]